MLRLWRSAPSRTDPPQPISTASKLYSAELEIVTLRAMIQGLLANIGVMRAEIASLRAQLEVQRPTAAPAIDVSDQVAALCRALEGTAAAVDSLRDRIGELPAPATHAEPVSEASRVVLADVRQLDRVGAAADHVATIAAVLRG